MNSNIKIVEVYINKKLYNYYSNEDNIIEIKIKKIEPNECEQISIGLKVYDIISENDVAISGYIKGNIKRNNIVEEIQIATKSIRLNVINPKLVLTMLSNTYEVIEGDIVEMVVLAQNKGNIDIKDIIIRNILVDEIKFINGSIELGSSLDKFSENMYDGINIGDLVVDEVRILKYKIKIGYSQETMFIENKATAIYTYTSLPCELIEKSSAVSNSVRILRQIESAKLEIECDKDDISINDEVSYTIKIINDGSLDLYNLVLKKDNTNIFQIVDNVIFNKNKPIKIFDFNEGIVIGNLKKNDYTEVKFRIKYIGGMTSNYVQNNFCLEKDFKFTNGCIFKGMSIQKRMEHYINISTFKCDIIEGSIYLEDENSIIKEINNIKADIYIYDYYIIDTVNGQSVDNTKSNGKKMIINANIRINLEYGINEDNGAVHFAYDEKRFSTFIVLPNKCSTSIGKYTVSGKCEYLKYKIEDNNKISITSSVLVIARFIGK